MSTPVIGIVAHPNRPEATKVAQRLADAAATLGAEARLRIDDTPRVADDDEFAAGLTACVAVGGDGTVLRAAHLVGTAGVPIVGVNVGRFGFLTEIDPAHAEAALTRVLNGEHVIEQVITLELTLPNGKCVWALNDVVLEKVESQRLVRLQLEVNGEIFTVYTCDGLIIATPTGSTAYNFSVGGPVVSPHLPCLIVVAVSPHMLFSRALVLAPTDHLTVHVMEDRPVGVTADGLDADIVPVGDSVALGIGATRIPFIRFEPESFPRRLARKFGL